MLENWIFLHNSFMGLLNRSQKKFYKFMYLFMTSLYAQHSVTALGDLYDDLLPFYSAFTTAYVASKSKKGIRKGDTAAQKLLFLQLYQEKMRDWHRRISIVHAPGTPDYIKIFPQGKTPLSTGPMEERITYFEAIIATLLAYVPLAAIRTEMVTFHTTLKSGRDTSAAAGSAVITGSADSHIAGEALAVEMYGALGMLMYLFKNNPERILEFINLSLLRQPQKPAEEEDNTVILSIAPRETKESGIIFTIDEKIRLYNSGNTILRIWFLKAIGDPTPTSFIDMAPDAVKEFMINLYANVGDRFMMVQNLGDVEEGTIEIEKV